MKTTRRLLFSLLIVIASIGGALHADTDDHAQREACKDDCKDIDIDHPCNYTTKKPDKACKKILDRCTKCRAKHPVQTWPSKDAVPEPRY